MVVTVVSLLRLCQYAQRSKFFQLRDVVLFLSLICIFFLFLRSFFYGCKDAIDCLKVIVIFLQYFEEKRIDSQMLVTYYDLYFNNQMLVHVLKTWICVSIWWQWSVLESIHMMSFDELMPAYHRFFLRIG